MDLGLLKKRGLYKYGFLYFLPPEETFKVRLLRSEIFLVSVSIVQMHVYSLLTSTFEEGLPLFKEGVVECFPLLFFEETTVCKNWKAFCLNVNKISGHIWVNNNYKYS